MVYLSGSYCLVICGLVSGELLFWFCVMKQHGTVVTGWLIVNRLRVGQGHPKRKGVKPDGEGNERSKCSKRPDVRSTEW